MATSTNFEQWLENVESRIKGYSNKGMLHLRLQKKSLNYESYPYLTILILQLPNVKEADFLLSKA